MKKQNLSIKELRTVLGKTQVQFANMVGVASDTIISIENGRNRLTEKLAKRIRVASGVQVKSLMDGKGKIINNYGKPYTRADFDAWKDFYQTRDEQAARMHFGIVKDWVELVFLAAVRSGKRDKDRFGGVWMSLQEWLEDTRANFNLGPEIDALLGERLKALGPMKERFTGKWQPSSDCPPARAA